MVKFVNILIGGAITPINVEDVVTVAATASGGEDSTVALSYKSGKVLTIQVEAGAGKGFGTQTTAAQVEKGFWGAILDAYEMPWNLPVYPAPGRAWTAAYDNDPVDEVDYVTQGADPRDTKFADKQPVTILNDDEEVIVWGSVAIS